MENKHVTEYEAQYVPTICPYCGTKLSWDGVDLICKNVECKNREEKNLKVWISNIAKVDGMSEVLIFKFFEELGIDSLSSLYEKQYEDYAFVDVPDNSHKGKFNKVLSKLLVESIDLKDLLVALNIKSLGEKNAEKLITNEEFVALIEEFIEINDVDLLVSELTKKCTNIAGPALISNICTPDGISKLRNIKLVENRVKFKPIIEVKKELIPVVITGKLSVPRKEFEKFLNEHGYEVKGAINKNIKYLITDNPNSGSSKNAAADKFGIEKITEEQIRKIINEV